MAREVCDARDDMSIDLSYTSWHPWIDVPPGSLCEVRGTSDARRYAVRWPAVVDGRDMAWVPSHGPVWRHAKDNASQGEVRVVASGLTAEQCSAVTRCDVKRAVHCATRLEEGNRAIPSAQVVTWDSVPYGSIGVVLTNTASKSAIGHIVLRWPSDVDCGVFVTSTVTWTWSTQIHYQGWVYIICDSLTTEQCDQLRRCGDLTTAFRLADDWARDRRSQVVTTTAQGPALVRLSRVPWRDVPLGAYVRADGGLEFLRWPKPWVDSIGVTLFDDCTARTANASDVSPDTTCLVLATGLSREDCNDLSKIAWPAHRWGVAAGFYVPLSEVPRGSIWYTVSEWGGTLSDGHHVANFDAEVRAGGTFDDATLVHVVLTDLSDDDIRTAVGACTGRSIKEDVVDVADVARRRWCNEVTHTWERAGREWLVQQFAEWVSGEVAPDLQATVAVQISMRLWNVLQEQPDPLRSHTDALQRFGLSMLPPNIGRPEWLGWWGQSQTPARAETFDELLAMYLCDPPDARQVLHGLGVGETSVTLTNGEIISRASMYMQRTDEDDEWAVSRYTHSIIEKSLTADCHVQHLEQRSLLTVSPQGKTVVVRGPGTYRGEPNPVYLPEDADYLVVWDYTSTQRSTNVHVADALAALQNHRARLRTHRRLHVLRA